MSTILEFDAALVLELMDHAEASKRWSMGYELEDAPPVKRGPGLLLVGDHGIYLMSNGLPGLLIAEGSKSQKVAYARGYNPEKDGAGEVFDRKRAAYGGDDGVDVLEWIPAIRAQLKAHPGQKTLRLIISDDGIELGATDLMPARA